MPDWALALSRYAIYVEQHELYMHRCLELGSQGRGLVGNGAMVGAVLVNHDQSTAEAFHEGFGKMHAERTLLTHIDQKMCTGSTLYVNLEPCVHHGKTPPCTEIIIERGIKRVVVGMMDPDPRVAGKGIAVLRRAGIAVIGPVERAACERLNRGFISVRKIGRPWITLKRAQTRDGRIANPDGTTLKITSFDQDRLSHISQRAQTDAILVGVETVIRDDPQLTIRHYTSQWQPWRIVLDPSSRMPSTAKLLTDSLKERTIIVSSLNNYIDQTFTYAPGLNKKMLVKNHDKKFEWESIWTALTTHQEDFPGITSILVEGGRRTWDIFRQNGFVDEEVVLVD